MYFQQFQLYLQFDILCKVIYTRHIQSANTSYSGDKYRHNVKMSMFEYQKSDDSSGVSCELVLTYGLHIGNQLATLIKLKISKRFVPVQTYSLFGCCDVWLGLCYPSIYAKCILITTKLRLNGEIPRYSQVRWILRYFIHCLSGECNVIGSIQYISFGDIIPY